MPCAFCGLPYDKSAGRERTGEHVFPKWTSGVLNPEREPITHTRSSTADSGPDTQWTDDEFSVVARQVCFDCNTGWMSGLEKKARRYVEPLILGKKRTLFKHGQTMLAAWSIKTALALNLATPEKSAPVEHYRAMAQTQAAPPQTHVQVGAIEENAELLGDPHTTALVLGGSMGSRARGYATTFAIGQLVVQVFGYTGIEDEITVTKQGATADAILQVWPYQATVEWPPRLILNFADLRIIGRAFETPQ